jgi:isomaltose glucohydrolase
LPAASSSVDVILAGQHASGAYVACPTFPPYRYSWFRDGCFIAEAMRVAGERESAERFLDWCARVVLATPDGPWDCRYNLDGSRDATDWPKLQLDGLGLFLLQVRRMGGSRWDDASACLRRWLETHWGDPCFDWWEERFGVHPSTLWCLGEGLDSDEVRREALRRADDRLDASLLVIGNEENVARVEDGLVSPGGGVHRHEEDVYYGGGEWLLLTAMLGVACAEQGRIDEAREKLAWVRAHARPEGLPEQAQDHLLHPDAYDGWVRKWGPPPSPLLWSHAMELLLAAKLES